MKVNGQSNLLSNVNQTQSKLSEQIASGKKVNSASDDVAALNIIERLNAQQSGLIQARQNANTGVSYTQVAESALGQVSENVARIGELSLQAANGALTDSDRQAIQSEVAQLQESISDTFTNTNFAGKPVFDGQNVDFQVGADANQVQGVNAGDASVINDVLSINVSTQSGAQAGIDFAQQSLEGISNNRATLGAAENAFERSISNLNQTEVNIAQSQSRLQDADLAKIISDKTANDILAQSQVALKAQANQSSAQVLNLL